MALMFVAGSGANAWVTSSNQTKIDKAVKLGAKGGIIYKEDGWEKKLLGMLPKDNNRFDAIIDGAGSDIVQKASKLLKVTRQVFQNSTYVWVDSNCVVNRKEALSPSMA
jgi:NADPH:quinone reductase-like Zn-dependent oxidoreductase